MRSLASAESWPGCARAASEGPDRGAAWADATSSSAAPSASAALAQRLTGLAVEEVHARDVDGDRDTLGEPEDGVRRALRDEMWPGGDDAALACGRLAERLVLALPDRERIDLEIDHRRASERLDELDLRLDRRQARALVHRVEVLASHAG